MLRCDEDRQKGRDDSGTAFVPRPWHRSDTRWYHSGTRVVPRGGTRVVPQVYHGPGTTVVPRGTTVVPGWYHGVVPGWYHGVTTAAEPLRNQGVAQWDEGGITGAEAGGTGAV